MEPLPVTAYTLSTAIGHGTASNLEALQSETSGLRPCDYEEARLDTWIGRVEDLETTGLPAEWQPYDCRNNRLAFQGLHNDGFSDRVAEARARYGPERIGLFLGTSTSGIRETERLIQSQGDGPLPADYHYRETHNLVSLVEFVAGILGLSGPAFTISTACSSSAKVFATAYRYIQAGLCDAAVVGGVDSLCLTTLYGFNALELVAPHPCRPWDRYREGLNIGEGAAFALLERDSAPAGMTALLGYGESSDGYHISTPHPEGRGAINAMQDALERAGLQGRDLDYVNLHGTATPSNDRSEDTAIRSLLPTSVPCSSTKGWTGHTLGAAGAIEAVVSLLALESGFVPGTLNHEQPDPELGLPVLPEGLQANPARVLSNSFGFGGSNCSLVFGRLA